MPGLDKEYLNENSLQRSFLTGKRTSESKSPLIKQ
jgi:hypothetical protein